jgi:hypothetical protein
LALGHLHRRRSRFGGILYQLDGSRLDLRLATGIEVILGGGSVATPTTAEHYRLFDWAGFKEFILPRVEVVVKPFGENVSRGTSRSRLDDPD